jgi:hypothetical protein
MAHRGATGISAGTEAGRVETTDGGRGAVGQWGASGIPGWMPGMSELRSVCWIVGRFRCVGRDRREQVVAAAAAEAEGIAVSVRSIAQLPLLTVRVAHVRRVVARWYSRRVLPERYAGSGLPA